MGHPLFIAALAITVFSAIGLLLMPLLLQPSAEEQRMLDVVTSARADRRSLRPKEKIAESISSIARALRKALGVRINRKSEERLLAAGWRSAAAPDLFFAAQCLMPLAGAFGGSFFTSNTVFWVSTLGGVGYLAPNFVLTGKIRRRREKMRRSLPDAIDLLVICVDAGLGLDQAVLRVCDELAVSHPELQEELARVYLAQRAGAARLEAWQELAARLKIAEIGAFVSMLTQTDRFGTPIARALSNFAVELRLKRRQLAEEAAAKTKIKIVFPLVFCIFPCLFIVLLAPAILAISRGLGSLAK